MKKVKSFTWPSPATPDRQLRASMPTLDGRNSLCSSLDDEKSDADFFPDSGHDFCTPISSVPSDTRKRKSRLLCEEPAFPSYTPLVSMSMQELAEPHGTYILLAKRPNAARLKYTETLLLPLEPPISTCVHANYFTRRTNKAFPSPLRFLIADTVAHLDPTTPSRKCAKADCPNVARVETRECVCSDPVQLCGRHAIESHATLVVLRKRCCNSAYTLDPKIRMYQLLEPEAKDFLPIDLADGPRHVLNSLIEHREIYDENSDVQLAREKVPVGIRIFDLRCGLVEKLALSIDKAKVAEIKLLRGNDNSRSHEHFSAYMDMIATSGLTIMLVDDNREKVRYIPRKQPRKQPCPRPRVPPPPRELSVPQPPPMKVNKAWPAHCAPIEAGDFFARRLNLCGIAPNSD